MSPTACPGATWTSSASRPYEVVGSSRVPVSSVSNTSPVSPGGAVPLSVNGLYLSKLVMRSGGTRSRSAALGRVRIHPLEMRETRRILDVAELGVGVCSQCLSGRRAEGDHGHLKQKKLMRRCDQGANEQRIRSDRISAMRAPHPRREWTQSAFRCTGAADARKSRRSCRPPRSRLRASPSPRPPCTSPPRDRAR